MAWTVGTVFYCAQKKKGRKEGESQLSSEDAHLLGIVHSHAIMLSSCIIQPVALLDLLLFLLEIRDFAVVTQLVSIASFVGEPALDCMPQEGMKILPLAPPRNRMVLLS